MNTHAATLERPKSLLHKLDPHSPALIVTGRDSLDVKGGVRFRGVHYAEDTLVSPPKGGYVAGADYFVVASDSAPVAELAGGEPNSDFILGGFHFAHGGNATAREGGDSIPAINPHSLWDINFRPVCPDPRGMTLITSPSGKFWVDIYLTNVDHLKNGTSKFGATIADGADRPLDAKGKKAKSFDYETAKAVMAEHAKGLLGLEDFFAAAIGVKEKSATARDPKVTKLDAERTSRFGLMQATGNLWIWGHAGDPDEPRASIFGGSWVVSGDAGSRYALVGVWPGSSGGGVGARGRSDHLELV